MPYEAAQSLRALCLAQVPHIVRFYSHYQTLCRADILYEQGEFESNAFSLLARLSLSADKQQAQSIRETVAVKVFVHVRTPVCLDCVYV